MLEKFKKINRGPGKNYEEYEKVAIYPTAPSAKSVLYNELTWQYTGIISANMFDSDMIRNNQLNWRSPPPKM